MNGHVYQRGKTFTIIYDLGKDPITGKRKQKSVGGFKSKPEAKAALRKILVEIDEGKYLEPSKETFSSYIEKWFNQHYRARVEETTGKTREYMLNKHLIELNPFKDKPLGSIDTEDIDNLYNLKFDEGYSPSYIRQMHNMLNKVFTQACKWKKLSYNPVQDADPPSIKKEEIIIWSMESVNQFLDACLGRRYYMTFYLALYTGMRRGEILGLQWSDIDFDQKVIFVNRSLAYLPQKGYVFKKLKTISSRRQIPLSEKVIDKLRLHKKWQDQEKDRFKGMYLDNDLVVCTRDGKPLDPQNVLRDMNICREKANVPKIRFHDMRHTHASILISLGVDVVVVSKRLGHINPRVTLETYAHIVPNKQDGVADLFEEALENHRNK